MGNIKSTPFSRSLGLQYPLIVAPMAGGPSSPELVVAASEAGALGSIGAAYYSPDAIVAFAERVRLGTAKPFGINLFISREPPEVSPDAISRAVGRTQAFREELRLPVPRLVAPYEEDFDRQFEAVLRARPKVFSTVFGVLAPEYVRAARKEGILVFGTATSPGEIQAHLEGGVDAIVAQGIEAGGHRGIFEPAAEDPAIRAIDLVRAMAGAGAKRVPIIAAGGIMSSADVQAMLAAGADAVQMGTAFLATKEAGTSAPYRKRLLAEGANRKTRTTRAFSGRLARGIVNRFMDALDPEPGAILPFPVQNKFTRDLRSASATVGSPEFLSLWAGTGSGDLWTGSTAELIRGLFD